MNEINHFKPEFVHAYPSSFKIITDYIVESKIMITNQFKSIFLGSENLPEEFLALFEEVYKCKIVNWYGHTERLIHGGNCLFSKEYHFYPFYGYIELLDENNKTITQPEKEGRIIATGFDNMLMPFIRYDTGDLGIISQKSKCTCGFSGLSLNKITGRGQDIILLNDRTKVSITAFIFGQHLKQFNRIREFQIIQNKIGKITILVALKDSISDFIESSLIDELKESVNNKLEIEVRIVDQIEKTHRGKHIFLKQNVKI